MRNLKQLTALLDTIRAADKRRDRATLRRLAIEEAAIAKPNAVVRAMIRSALKPKENLI